MPQDTSDARAPSAVELAPGQVLQARYRIVEQIGRGGTGVVYRAHDEKKGRDIAIKVVYPERLSHDTVRKTFLDETRIACELFHPGVVKPTGVYSSEQITFITSELLEGQTLRQLMDERRRAGNPFSRQEVVRIISSLIDILQYAHLRTVHRNLKPENIWVDGNNRYRIMDFGVAVLVRSVRPSRKKPPVGIGLYIAPEQWKSWQQVGSEADQYALGVMACELINGSVSARKINSIRRRYKKVNKNILSVIARMVALNPTGRFDSILLAREALSETESSTRSLLASRSLRVLAVIALLAVALTVILHSRDHLLRYWDSVRPLSEAEQQLMFDDMIARANDINQLDRLLRRARLDLESNIRKIQSDIRDSEDDLLRSTLEADKTKLRQRLDTAGNDLARQQALKVFTDRIVFNDEGLQQLDSKIRETFLLFEQGEHQRALELISPLQTDLARRLQQFENASNFLAMRERLDQARSEWRQFHESSELQAPPDLEQRERAIADAQRRAENGELDGIPEQFEQWIAAYRSDLLRDRERVEQRANYLAQQETTLEIEQRLSNYLQQNNLRIDAAQADRLQRVRAEEREQRSRNDFNGAAASNRELAQILQDYLAAARSAVAEARLRLAEEQARQARARSKQAAATAVQGDRGNDAVVAADPVETQSSPQPARASGGPLPISLDEYIPGLTLVDIPTGRFSMGSSERGGERDEQPVRDVAVRGFAMMKFEVTFDQFDHYARLTGKPLPNDAGWGRGSRPVINVDWNQASDYADWLSQSTGLKFRLPSEAEWEYAARGGSITKYPWGNEPSHDRANYGNEFCCSGLARDADQWVNTAPVGSFDANRYGLSDMHGNVAEWALDCWNDSYNGAPTDARPRFSGHCNRRVVRGGSWSSESSSIRSANRNGIPADKKTSYIGFRLVLER